MKSWSWKLVAQLPLALSILAIYLLLSPTLSLLLVLLLCSLPSSSGILARDGDFLLPDLQTLPQEHGDAVTGRRRQAQDSPALGQEARKLVCRLLQLQGGQRGAGDRPRLAVVPRADVLPGAVLEERRRGGDDAGGGEDGRQVGAPVGGAGEGVPADGDGEAGRVAHLRAHGDPAAVGGRAGPCGGHSEPAVAHVHQGGAGRLRGHRHGRRLLGAAALLRRAAGGVLLPAGAARGGGRRRRGGAHGAVRGGDAGAALRHAGERRLRRRAGQARGGRRQGLPLLRRLLRVGAPPAARRGARGAVARRRLQPRRARPCHRRQGRPLGGGAGARLDLGIGPCQAGTARARRASGRRVTGRHGPVHTSGRAGPARTAKS